MTDVSWLTTEELLAEFIDAYRSVQEVPLDTEAVIVLTADGGDGDLEENERRITHALQLLQNAALKRVPLIFSGVTEERSRALDMMEKLGVSEELRFFQDCGRRGMANTKTQFEAVRTDDLTSGMRNVAFITSTYHVPRTRRTAGKQLPPEMAFVVSSDIRDWKLHNSFLKIVGEIERIKKYAVTGDILARPRS